MENRNTKQRDLLYNLINNCKYHYTAEEVYDIVKESMGLATVYRNLNYLTDKNLIRKINLNNNKIVYDKIGNYHYHMQCSKCNDVFDISIEKMPYMKDLDDNLNNIMEEKIINHDIVFSCICKKCIKD